MTSPSEAPTRDAEATLPVVALRDADTGRAQRGYLGAAIVCAAGIAGLQLVQGPVAWRWAASIVCTLAGLFCAWLAWTRRRGGLYSGREAATAALLLCVAALSGLAYVGPLTAPSAILILLVVGLAMGHEERGRLAFVVIFVGYALLGGLAIIGAIPAVSPALVEQGAVTAILGTLLVLVVLAVSYFFGRASRRSTERALQQVQRTRLAIAARDALLDEARADLARLAGEGRAGRYSGVEVGSYELKEIVGRGGMGEVYRAIDEDGSEAAIKLLHPHLVTQPVLLERFFREARVSSELDSPHIVRVLGNGVAPDGAPYLAMEWLRGRDLSDILREQRSLDLAEIEELVCHAARGLAAAHAAGIVHRDIKPGNLMRLGDRDPCWKVLDFGVSKLLTGDSTLTRDAAIGTPGYMPPEQALGLEVDHRADVFALGAVIYRAVTGRPAFSGPDAVSVMLQATQLQPPRPGTLASIPADVDLVLALALAKERNQRLESASLLASAFAEARMGRLDPALRARAKAHLIRSPWVEAPFARVEGPDGATLPVSSH